MHLPFYMEEVIAFRTSSHGSLDDETCVTGSSATLPGSAAATADTSRVTAATERRRSSLQSASTAPSTARGNEATSASSAQPSLEKPKPKQSKSRNGCVTCKAKRLKCDETKPTCLQCAKRSVACGGYKKDFKWRTFEDVTFSAKPLTAQRSKPRSNYSPTRHSSTVTIASSSSSSSSAANTPAIYPDSLHASPMVQQSFASAARTNISGRTDSHAYALGHHISSSAPMPSYGASVRPPPLLHLDTLNMPSLSEIPRSLVSPDGNIIYSATTQSPLFGHTPFQISDHFESPLTSQGESLLFARHSPAASDEEQMKEEFTDLEDVLHSPNVSDSGFASPHQLIRASRSAWTDNPGSTPLILHAQFDPGSIEMLTVRFDRITCGIMSICDGPTENPWRTHVLPMAKGNAALYHAVASMASFHASTENPNLRKTGIYHARQSLRELATGLSSMRTETALATTLALVFSETWDMSTSAGLDHIKGARALVRNALSGIRHSAGEARSGQSDDPSLLRFLCNTWIYVDVLSRLTAIDDDDDSDDSEFEDILAGLAQLQPQEDEVPIDPLMGCASTLFPSIGYVANLARRVRRTRSVSRDVLAHGHKLMHDLLSWAAPASLQAPEDPTLTLVDTLQTAEAYRWSTVLYLHQILPSLPLPPDAPCSAELARRALRAIAAVPVTSRAIIVQIYPLLAAGCEVTHEADRAFVRDRWAFMAHHMAIGNINRCEEVIGEVWRRRDNHYAPSSGMMSFARPQPIRLIPDGSGEPALTCAAHVWDNLSDPEYSICGKLHWFGVMRDWQWEVLLG